MHIIDGKSYDLIVCGCGVAGFAAAVQGARAGLKTAVIERHGMPGGILTVGGNNDIAQFFAHHRQVIRGIGWEYVTRLAEAGYAVIPDKMADGPHWIYGVHVNIPAAAHLMDVMLTEAGADLYYGQPVAAVDTEETDAGIHVTGVVIASKEGLRRLSAKVVIDCTGDGDAAVYAGARFECGGESEDGFLQPGTIRFYIDKPDLPEEVCAGADRIFAEYRNNGTMDPTDLRGLSLSYIMNARGNNIGHVSGFNAADSDSRTASEVAGRASVYRLMNALQDAGAPVPIEAIAPEVAVRESRRILCDGYMTEENYVSGYAYPDAVCTSFYPIDLHRHGDNGIRQTFLTDGQIPTVPLSALIVKGIDNMLVAGRCASGDRLANSAYRVKASCMAMGQAAAACAAVAVRDRVSIRQADLARIRALLREHDAIVTADDVTD
ncbi:MAG: FAD-dependent oxidoreductase [Ruminococcaceae bacterium]|nr:FAD-dependent oxidoreductase [Oscillospiraceae bacterium]